MRIHGAHAVVEHDGGSDDVAVEEPLEIRVDGAPLAVTMRTPGHDLEIAHGFLHTEGIIGSVDEVTATPTPMNNSTRVLGTKALDAEYERVKAYWRDDMMRRGVIARFLGTSVIAICPPLVIEDADVDRILEALHASAQ